MGRRSDSGVPQPGSERGGRRTLPLTVSYGSERAFEDAGHFFGRLVDQVEQPGKAVAKIEAAPAAMADVEDAAHLLVQLRRVGEIRIGPGKGMPGRRVEAAFSHPADPGASVRPMIW